MLLVWRSEDLASRYNCKESGDITAYDCGDLGQTCVDRCPFKRAMQLIVLTDPERAKRRVEYNEILAEKFGEDYDGDEERSRSNPSTKAAPPLRAVFNSRFTVRRPSIYRGLFQTPIKISFALSLYITRGGKQNHLIDLTLLRTLTLARPAASYARMEASDY